MKALVTGGTGFIGSHLIERLRERGDEVVCVAKDRLNVSVLETLNVHVVLSDLNNGIGWDSVLQGVDVIYHLAGVTRTRKWKDYYDGNYLATKRFVDICLRNCPTLKRFVYVGSLAAVGPALDGKPLEEDAPYHPVSHYGKSKMLGEIEVLKARDRLPITVIRPSIVYGPRERDMYDYIRLIKRGIHPIIGFKKKFFSILHSDDIVEGILQAAGYPGSVNEVYDLGSEEFYTTQDLGEAIGKVVERRPLHIHVPHTLVYTVGVIGEVLGKMSGKQVFLNIQKAKETVQPAWICSVEKAKRHFGFHQRIGLEEGMRKTYTWYRENGWI